MSYRWTGQDYKDFATAAVWFMVCAAAAVFLVWSVFLR